MKTNFSKGYHFQNSMIQVVRNAYPRPLRFLNVDFAFFQLWILQGLGQNGMKKKT
jgi:hypothetical protein